MRATVIDSAGNTVGSATHNISFEIISGPGVVLGAHNGDTACHEPNSVPWRSAYHGLVRAIVRVTSAAGRPEAERELMSYVDGYAENLSVSAGGVPASPRDVDRYAESLSLSAGGIPADPRGTQGFPEGLRLSAGGVPASPRGTVGLTHFAEGLGLSAGGLSADVRGTPVQRIASEGLGLSAGGVSADVKGTPAQRIASEGLSVSAGSVSATPVQRIAAGYHDPVPGNGDESVHDYVPDSLGERVPDRFRDMNRERVHLHEELQGHHVKRSTGHTHTHTTAEEGQVGAAFARAEARQLREGYVELDLIAVPIVIRASAAGLAPAVLRIETSVDEADSVFAVASQGAGKVVPLYR